MHHNNLIFFIFMALYGCGGGPGAADARPAGNEVAEIGTGTTQFVSLEPEQDLTLYAGPQGGHHFIVHARMKGMAPGDPFMPGGLENPRTRFSAFTESGEQVDEMLPPYVLGYRDEGDDWFYLLSGRLLIMNEARVPELFGNRVRLRVEVSHLDGDSATDEVWVRAVAEPPDGL